MGALAAAYRPRRPTETVLYAVVRDHLETFVAHARETYDAPIPRYVEQELRGYLRCGVFAHGFVRCHCDACGHDLLVLSLPFELRALAAFRADVLSALGRCFIEAVFARYRAWAKRHGLGDAPTGAVTHTQRFGSSINLHVHFHSMLLDGVFTRDAQGGLRFHLAPSPTREELSAVVRRVRQRALAWLQRRKLLDASPAAGASQEPLEQTSLDACAAIAMQRGAVRALRDDPDVGKEGGGSIEAPPRDDGAVELDGFNLHASVTVAGDDDLSRERLMRYGARPPLALDRLRRLPDGRVAYRIKKLRDGRAKHRIMTPLEFLARLAAIVPPPRFPLLRYAGVLAPASKWRSSVVPRAPEPPESKPRRERSVDERREVPCNSSSAPGDERRLAPSVSPSRAPPTTRPTPPETTTAEWQLLTPNVLSVRHWDRLLGGALYAATPRVDWASLLRRSFSVDVLECARCGGRLRVLGEVTEPTMVRLVLDSLGMPTGAPRVARARDPTDLLDADHVS